MIARDFNGYRIVERPAPAATTRRKRRRRTNAIGMTTARPGARLRGRIDRGLKKLVAIARHGEPLTAAEIAAACRVSDATILEIQHSALRKLRLKLDPNTNNELRSFLYE